MARTGAERRRVERVAVRFDPAEGFNRVLIRFGADHLLVHRAGDRVLEMGCGRGEMTVLLRRQFRVLEVVEGSARLLEVTRRRVRDPRVVFHHALFEEFEPAGRYSDILLTSILEHVADPVRVMRRAGRWLLPRGRLHIIAPNAASLHRQLGVRMGLLRRVTALNPLDRHAGHRRVYTPATLLRDVRRAGLAAVHADDFLLKPLPNAQMMALGPRLWQALYDISPQFPGVCAHLYVCAGRAQSGA